MKHKTLFLSLVLLGILACTESVTEPLPASDTAILPAVTAAAPGNGNGFVEKITGSGHYITPPPSFNVGLWRTFTMTAKKTADGAVDGRWQRVLHPEGEPSIKVRGTISCFTVVDNKAWIGGHRPGNEPSDVVWQVVDNGERNGDPADLVGLQIEAVQFGFEAGLAEDFCENTPDFMDFGPPFGVLPLAVVLAPIEGGNIQIH